MPKQIKCELISISTFNENYFNIKYAGKEYKCRLVNSWQWDTLYNFLMEPLRLNIESEAADGTLWVAIV